MQNSDINTIFYGILLLFMLLAAIGMYTLENEDTKACCPSCKFAFCSECNYIEYNKESNMCYLTQEACKYIGNELEQCTPWKGIR